LTVATLKKPNKNINTFTDKEHNTTDFKVVLDKNDKWVITRFLHLKKPTNMARIS